MRRKEFYEGDSVKIFPFETLVKYRRPNKQGKINLGNGFYLKDTELDKICNNIFTITGVSSRNTHDTFHTVKESPAILPSSILYKVIPPNR